MGLWDPAQKIRIPKIQEAPGTGKSDLESEKNPITKPSLIQRDHNQLRVSESEILNSGSLAFVTSFTSIVESSMKESNKKYMEKSQEEKSEEIEGVSQGC